MGRTYDLSRKTAMSHLFETLRDKGFWLRSSALLVNIVTTVLWVVSGELPTLCGEQTKVFLHVVPGFNVVLLALTVVSLVEPLEAFVHRILGLTGVCLSALTGTIGVVNYIAVGYFQISSLFISLLCLLNCILLTTDLIVLECTYPLERRDPPFYDDTLKSSVTPNDFD